MKKYIVIWFALMAVIVLLVNFGGGFLAGKLYGDILMPAYTGYAKKMEFPLPEATDEKQLKINGARMMVRCVLCDDRIYGEKGLLSNLTLSNMTIDESKVFLNPDGAHPFSYGIFASVYHDEGNGMDYIHHPVGVLDVRKFSAEAGADKLYESLAQHKDAVIRLDAYTVKDYVVHPAKITLTDSSGNVFYSQEFAAEGDIIREDNCLIRNTYEDQNDCNSLYNKLLLSYEGERSCDRKAAKIAEEVRTGQYSKPESTTSYGIGKVTRTYIETEEGYIGAFVVEMNILKGILFYIALLGLIMTVILTIVGLKRR